MGFIAFCIGCTAGNHVCTGGNGHRCTCPMPECEFRRAQRIPIIYTRRGVNSILAGLMTMVMLSAVSIFQVTKSLLEELPYEWGISPEVFCLYVFALWWGTSRAVRVNE